LSKTTCASTCAVDEPLSTCPFPDSCRCAERDPVSDPGPILKSGRETPRPPACQDFALKLSTKRRLCKTIGGRFIDGTARCCAVSAARSLAATTTNLARSSLAFWSLRRILGGAKTSVLVNLFTICPPMRPVASRPRPNSVPDHGHLMACFTDLGKRSRNRTDPSTPLSPGSRRKGWTRG